MIENINDVPKDFIKGNKRHAGFKITEDIADHLAFHIQGFKPARDKTPFQQGDIVDHTADKKTENPYFVTLIDERRPSEEAEWKDYRRKIYKSKTRQPCFKVINSLKKIVRAEDWRIDYSESDQPARIKEGERLEDYAEKNYPLFGSVENWLYTLGVQHMLTDPNGLVCVYPVNFDVPENEFVKPFTYFITSHNVIDYKAGEHAIVKTEETRDFKDKNNARKIVPVYLILTQTEIFQTWQINDKGDFQIDQVYVHNFGKVPAFRIGGVMKEVVDNSPIYESFLDPMLDELDEAAREYSDVQAEIVQHMHSIRWDIAGQDCASCKGTGRVRKEGEQVVCGKCKGEGTMPASPFKNLTMKLPAADQVNLPVPPIGYVAKDTAIVELQDRRITDHIFAALASLNMEFLAQTPLNQSGVAKEVDRDELNNFVYGVAYHLVENVLKPIYKIIVKYRYGILIQSEDERMKMMPSIVIPEKYDLLGEAALTQEIARAQEASVDPTIINELNKDFCNKKFRDDTFTREKLKAINALNPFSSMGKAEVNDLMLSKTITKKDAVICTYINAFVEQAIADDEGFLELDFNKQKEIISKMADEKIESEQPEIQNPFENQPPEPPEGEETEE